MKAMKSALRTCVVLALSASTLLAQTAPVTTTKTTTKTRTTRKHVVTKAAPAVTADDLKQLRDMMAAQQQQLDQMRQDMQQRNQQLQQTQQQLADAQSAAREAQAKASAVETASTEQKATTTQLQSDMTDVRSTLTNTATSTQDDQKKVNELAGLLGRFRFTGDVRVRFDDQFQDAVANRYRPRIRLRLGVEGKLSEDFFGGIAIASGGLNDPTSTNSTLGDAWQRKPVGFDRGYVTYNPLAHKFLSITGGKFAYTWIRTNQSFDPDINPEGFSEKLSFDVKSVPMVKNVSFTGLQLYLNETNNTATNASAAVPKNSNDTWAYGGQLSAKLQPTSWWTMTPSYTVLNFPNVDALINGYANLASGTSALDASRIPGLILSSAGFAPNGMTNAICPRTVSGVNIPKFCSNFLYSDLIISNVFKTRKANLPINLMGEYETNLKAASNRSHLYQAEISVGQTKNKKDYQFGYAFTRSEQDSVIASFAESDQRFPTNVLQHRIFGVVKIAPNTTFGYTQWFGRALDTNVPNTVGFGFVAGKPYGYGPTTIQGGREPWVKRGQLDLIYTF